uniref:Ras GTPase-activating-like protein IQGAP1 n=1 Tax=Sinocyclocheilus rhinocerous TaxID=307959 RepID=A0A673NRJ4_9TELE
FINSDSDSAYRFRFFSIPTIVDDERLSAEEMDERRMQNIAYEYLCHLEEAKQWMEACLGEQLPPTTELEHGLRNGVYLGKLAKFFAPQLVSEKKIYDRDQSRYKHSGLHFRHTDNTVQWLRAMESVGLPKIFYPETTDVYDRKNMPKVIYCIHALRYCRPFFSLNIYIRFTEEEISNMRKELDKYGIQMPAFSKIGGILANELSVDEAALHAAVFAINEAIDKGHAESTMVALQNPNALLRNTQKPLVQAYQDTLSKAKRKKEDQLNQALDAEDQKALLASLRLPALGLVGVLDDNSSFYLEHFTSYREHKQLITNLAPVYIVCLILLIIVLLMDTEQEVVAAINAAIRRGIPEETVEALLNPEAQLPIVYHTAASLYQAELFSLQLGCQAGLTHEELCVAVEMLSAVSVLNEVLDTKDSVAVIEQLSDSPLGFSGLDADNLQRYADTLIRLRAESLAQGQEFITWNDVQKCIDIVNVQVHEEHERVIAIAEINEALNSGDPEKTLAALLLPTAKLQGVNPANAKHYHNLLLSGDESAVLWLDQIQEAVHTANRDQEDALKLAEAVADINRAVSEGDAKATLAALQCPDAGLRAVLSECAHVYHSQLAHLQSTQTEQGTSGSLWMKHKIKDKYDYFYNIESKEGTWVEPDHFVHDSSQLTKEDIQSVLSSVTAEYNREQLWLANEALIIQLHALIRGYLVRRAHNDRLKYLRKQELSVIKLQASWKGYKQRRVYKDRLKTFQDSVSSAIKLQSLVKMWKAKRSYTRRLKYFKDHVMKIQAYLKANKARVDYRTLTGSQHPPLSVVRKFVHLLEQSSLDLQEEQEVTRLREEVVTKIRSNQQMEKDLNLMDIKIGLLVKNRITLQDVVSHSKKMKSKKNKMSKEDLAMGEKQGIKGLSKEKRKKLEAYQHLFYLLQTNPSYLAKLIFQMPQNKSTKFMDTVIFTLYNYASNQREEYLLLKLFESALREEIKSKVDHIQEIVTGNPTVIKMVLSFYRGARGQNALRQLLGPVVKEIIEDKNLGINTNPVDIYKAWVNQLETATGEARFKPAHTIHLHIFSSSTYTLSFWSHYGMRYIAKVLNDTLHKKFPDATEDELLKIVGTLLYYRYMNPAIVAPDGFDIIDMTAGGQVHSEQRRNLASVAKMLQHAAANKLFEDESDHLTLMNSYISQTYQRFRGFFQAACDVPAPEEKFNVDEYSDMVTLSKPIIYISIEEIINTHSLVLEHKEAIAPDHSDLLHELLKNLGEVPDVESLLGEGALDADDPSKENSLSQLAKTEVSLTLTNKFELLEGDDKDMKGLMMKTKKLIVDVVRIQAGETLIDILETPASAAQEAEHAKLVERQVVQDSQTPEGLKSSKAMLEDCQLPLEQKKRKILRNLRTLEQAGLVSSKHKYQEVINDISKDIRYQRRYRQRRKAELVKLQQTLTALNSKAAFYQEQINYYDTYIKTCLDNLNRKKEEKSSKKASRPPKASSLKYTAAKLHEKGVILEIEGLQTNQLKNVMFDICPCEEVGDFEIKAKFMGVEMEKVQLHFQDLLQLQYEGVAVMKMFDKAKVNVNLLIFLLNKKFYGK